MKIIEYWILDCHDMYILKDEVNKYIKNGRQPIGGVCYCDRQNDKRINMYAQAMVKYLEEKEE